MGLLPRTTGPPGIPAPAVGGHLHEFGTQVRLENAETGEVLVKLDGLYEDGRFVGVEQKILRKRLGWREGA